MKDSCKRECLIEKNDVRGTRWQCGARLKYEHKRCSRVLTQDKFYWVKFPDTKEGKRAEKFFPFCKQHKKQGARPFDFAEGTEQPHKNPIGRQGFAIGPECIPVRLENKWQCPLDEKNLAGTTCWKDASIVKSPAFEKAQLSCKKKPKKKSPPGRLPFIPFFKKYTIQGMLTKAAAKDVYYDDLAFPLLQKLTNLFDKIFNGKVLLVLKGSRALYYALSNSLSKILTLRRKKYFPFLLCEPKTKKQQVDIYEEEQEEINRLLPPSDYDAQIFLNYSRPAQYRQMKQMVEEIINAELLSLITKRDAKNTKFFTDVPKRLSEENIKNALGFGFQISASKRRSFAITDNNKFRFNFRVRKFIENINFDFNETVEFETKRKEKLESLQVSFGEIPRIWNLKAINKTRYQVDLEGMDVNEFKEFYGIVTNTRFPLLEIKEILSLPNSTYMTSQTLRIYEQLPLHFTLLRLMAPYQIIPLETGESEPMKAKTKAEIVDLAIQMPDHGSFEDDQTKFLRETKKYTFTHEGVRMGNLRYHEEEFLRLLQEVPRAKTAKDRQRMKHIYMFICCISQMSETVPFCVECELKPIESAKKAKEIVNNISSQLQTYGGLEERDMTPFKRGLLKFPYKTLQFLEVFVSRMSEKVVGVGKEGVQLTRKEKATQIRSIIEFVQASGEDACITTKSLIKGVSGFFGLSHFGQDISDLQTPLDELFELHGYD